MSIKEQEEKVKEYLNRHKIYKQMLNADEYAEEYSNTKVPLCDKVILRAKMNEIEHFIMSLPVSREQTLLFNHYVRGHSIEFCGEMMYLSRRTAYRIAKKAVEIAALHYHD